MHYFDVQIIRETSASKRVLTFISSYYVQYTTRKYANMQWVTEISTTSQQQLQFPSCLNETRQFISWEMCLQKVETRVCRWCGEVSTGICFAFVTYELKWPWRRPFDIDELKRASRLGWIYHEMWSRHCSAARGVKVVMGVDPGGDR